MVQCDNDGDASIMNVALIEATGDSIEVNTIFYLYHFAWLLILQLQAKDADFLIMLVATPLLKYQPSTFSPRQKAFTMWRWSEKRSLTDIGASCSFVMFSLVEKVPYLTSFVQGILMNTWRSSLTYRLLKTQWLGDGFAEFTMQKYYGENLI